MRQNLLWVRTLLLGLIQFRMVLMDSFHGLVSLMSFYLFGKIHNVFLHNFSCRISQSSLHSCLSLSDFLPSWCLNQLKSEYLRIILLIYICNYISVSIHKIEVLMDSVKNYKIRDLLYISYMWWIYISRI